VTTSYRTVSVDGLKVFYREAGDRLASFNMHTDTAKVLEAVQS
jgi:hypothetical protein